MRKSDIISEIERISTQDMSKEDMSELSQLIEELRTSNDKDIDELTDIFPALKGYKEQHSLINLQKLCVEIADFCRAVYASTQNDAEREVYRNMLQKLTTE